MNRFGFVHKLTVVIGLGFLMVLATAYLASRQMTSLLLQHAGRILEREVADEGKRIAIALEGDRAVVLALRRMPPAEGLVRARRGGGTDRSSGSSFDQWGERYESIFEAVLREHPSYRQLRFLDHEGEELVRVDSDGRQVQRIPPGELQSKRERDYVRQGLSLRDGAVGTSEMSLNQERGQIVRPFQPMVRIYTPVVDESLGVVGLVVLNRDGSGLLTTLQTIYGPTVRMTDEAGYFLVHPNPAALWGFDLGHETTLSRENPAIWQKVIAGGVSGSRYNPESDTMEVFAKIRFDPFAPSRFWLLETEVPAEDVLGDLRASRARLFLAITLLAGGLLGVLVVLGRRMMRSLARLEAGTRAIIQGDLGVRVPVDSSDEVGRLAAAFNHMAESLQEDIRRREAVERRLKVERDVARVLAESSTPEEALGMAIRVICEALGCDLGAMWTVDQAAHVLWCQSLWHADSAGLASFAAASREITFSPGVGLPGRVWVSGHPGWIPDVTQDPNCPRKQAVQGVIHGALAFPIRSGGEMIGVMECFSRRPREPDDELLQMFEALGNQLGPFLQRKWAEEQIGKISGAIKEITRRLNE